jgi:hypothetical protein
MVAFDLLAASAQTVDESKELEWQSVKRRMMAVVPAFEEHATGPSPYFQLSEKEKETLRTILKVPPATRSYSEVRTLLNLLRGSDLFLQLDDDVAATVAGSMRILEFEKGDVIATEQNAHDAFLLAVEGMCTVLVRDITVTPPRAPLFHIVRAAAAPPATRHLPPPLTRERHSESHATGPLTACRLPRGVLVRSIRAAASLKLRSSSTRARLRLSLRATTARCCCVCAVPTSIMPSSRGTSSCSSARSRRCSRSRASRRVSAGCCAPSLSA